MRFWLFLTSYPFYSSSLVSHAAMFQNCTVFDQNITRLDTSNVVDMSNMLKGASSFTNDGADLILNTESVETMSGLFDSTTFNGNIASWNTTNVRDFSFLAANNLQFDGYSITDWSTSSATSMAHMFDGCVGLRGNFASFDVSNVQDFSYMFRGASTWTSDLSSWQTGSAINMTSMFEGCGFFNRDLNAWDTSNVLSMRAQFRDATGFFGLISNWTVGNVVDFSSMFENAGRFDGDVRNWDVGSAVDFSSMFKGSSFNRDLSNWNISSQVEDMSGMFSNASSFAQTLCWDIGESIDTTAMFQGSGGCLEPSCLDESLWGSFECIDLTPGGVGGDAVDQEEDGRQPSSSDEESNVQADNNDSSGSGGCMVKSDLLLALMGLLWATTMFVSISWQ
jgi:surface protein